MQVEEKKKLLRKYPYFKLQINLLNGKDLLAMDRGGLCLSKILFKEQNTITLIPFRSK